MRRCAGPPRPPLRYRDRVLLSDRDIRAELASGRIGLDDLTGTLAKIPDGAPAILLAHEPDIFPQVPPRIALTLFRDKVHDLVGGG